MKRDHTLTFQGGVTFIELIVVVAVVVLLALIGVGGYSGLRSRGGLEYLTQDVRGKLEQAHSNTISSEQLSSWGVHFEQDRYMLFKGVTFDPATSSNQVFSVGDNLEIATPSLANATQDVVFVRPFGTTGNYGTIVVRSLSSGEEREIRIDQAGLVSVDTDVPPAPQNPQKDTRHVHFDISIPITNFTVLSLVFHDPPNPDVRTDANIADCLDQSGTVFDCDIAVVVGGVEQHIRVSTHYLDAFSTVLSINRDRRENDKAVDVWFDYPGGMWAAEYAADGTVIKGPSAFVGNPQIQ